MSSIKDKKLPLKQLNKRIEDPKITELKLAAIDALSHIERPEYKDELTTLFTLAQTDTNPLVAMAATRAIERAAQDDSAQ